MHQSVEAIVKEFTLSQKDLENLEKEFIREADKGLAEWLERGLPMIPTYVSVIPTGKEQGVYLAADLGGTNFRVCSVTLHGNHQHSVVQSKWPVPQELMLGTSEGFFGFLAERVQEFLGKHHEDHLLDPAKPFRMGFTFSFPIRQTSVNTGTLLRWTKGFDIEDTVGLDVGKLFQEQLDKLNLHVHIAALVNDTVGALMARAYTNETKAQTIIGCIVGTGTNAAYFDRVKNITKYEGEPVEFMAVNTEFGSFDNDLVILPNTKYDVAVDKLTPNPTFHMFEKRVGGMFLGELLRQVLYDLHQQGVLFVGTDSKALATPWSIDTSVPSVMGSDTSNDLNIVGEKLLAAFDIETNLEDRKASQAIANAIGKRSAYLVAVAFAGLLEHTKALESNQYVDIGGDGSVFEFYPSFQDNIREGLRILIGDDEKRVTFGLAKDGSGVGAALCALELGC